MDREPRCELTDLPVSGCYDCRHNTHGKPTPPDVAKLMHMVPDLDVKQAGANSGVPIGTKFTARYTGTCNWDNEDCGGVKPGEEVVRTEDGYVHARHLDDTL